MNEDGAPRPSNPSSRFSQERARTHGTIHPIYAAMFDLDPDGYEHACDVVLNWVRTHPSVQNHVSALSGHDFDFNDFLQTGLAAQATRSPDGDITVVRLQHREVDLRTRKLDRLRDWRTEVTIERGAGYAWIATRQWFAGVAGDSRECRPPRFVKQLWNENALSDIEIFERTCRIAESDNQADHVADLITDVNRNFPVIAIADGCPMSAERVTADFIGLAHVVQLSRSSRYRLNAKLTELSSLAHGSLQTFYPLVADEALAAPASRFQTIIGWRFRETEGPSAFSKWLRAEIGSAIVTRFVNDVGYRSYEEIRARIIQAQRTDTAPSIDLELMALAEEEISNLHNQLAELKERAQSYLNQKAAAEEQVAKEIEKNRRLKADKLSVQLALNAKGGAEPIKWDAKRVESLIAEQPNPRNILEAIEQAQRLFLLHDRRVKISPEAEEGAMKALHFKRPGDIQAALIRLGFLWNDIRASGQRLGDAAKQGLRFPCAMFESKITMRDHGEERAVWVDGTLVRLPKHIKFGSGGKDDAARMHFGDKDGEVLIGHIGRHLTTSQTN